MHKFSQETAGRHSVGTSWIRKLYSCESETAFHFPGDQFEMIRAHQKKINTTNILFVSDRTAARPYQSLKWQDKFQEDLPENTNSFI